MARLVLLNGPPGIGKSTIARCYVDDHPLALDLDLDVVRSLIGRWADDAGQAGELARAIALEMARTHLRAGHDVIVPQLLARLEFIEALEALAASTGATFHEIVLMDTKANALERFRARGQMPEVGDADLHAYHDRLTTLLRSRPDVIVIQADEGQVDATYAAVSAALDPT